MNPERWEQIKDLFGSALEREPGERSAFLREACGEDESLRAELESLLASCGPDTFPEYRVPPGVHRWSWTLRVL